MSPAKAACHHPIRRHLRAPSLRAAAVWLVSGFSFYGHPAGAADQTLTSIAQAEVHRREAIVSDASHRLDEAGALFRAQKWQEAVDAYSQIYQSLPNAAMAAAARDRARTGFAAAGCNRARELMGEARYAEATELLDNVLSANVDPGNREARKLKAQLNDPDRFPRALTPEHIGRVKQVASLLELANSALELGEYDKAIKTWQSVLRIDPYNESARRGMERAEKLRAGYFDSARDHTRSALLGLVDKEWEQQVPLSADMSSRFAAGAGYGATEHGGREAIMKKLRSLVVPKVDFNSATLEETVEYLRVRSRDLDPQGRGVNFVVSVPPESATKPVTLYLEQVPMDEIVRYITEKSGAAYRVEDTAVVILSLSQNTSQLIAKTYRVPPTFIQTSLVGDQAGGAGAPADPFANAKQPATGPGLKISRMSAKDFLESRGVTFKEGATASYVAVTNSLFVRNTPENIAIVDELVDQSTESAPKQVLVSVKLMEVDQKNYDELRNDIGLGAANVPGSDRVFVSGGQGNSPTYSLQGVSSTTDGLRPSGAILGKPSIDSLLTKNTNSPAIDSASSTAFQLFGVFTDPQFQAMVAAISQKKGTDLVSVPSVVTKSGVQTQIEMVREFPYPTEFQPPQIPQQIGGSTASLIVVGAGGTQVSSASALGNIPITPTTPTAFETRKVGSLMEIEAVISPDGRQVELTLAPSTTEFEGFINYGSPIQSSNSSITYDPTTFTLGTKVIPFTVENQILQPIFRTNKLSTAVLVWDGSTIVLGGVISEKRDEINDKVPILGDIPILGKLWHSKIKQVQKKNVIFFVNVKVIDAAGQPIRPQVAAAKPQ